MKALPAEGPTRSHVKMVKVGADGPEWRGPLHIHALTGAGAVLTTDVWLHAIDTIKTRLQGQPHPPRYFSLQHAGSRILTEEGLRGVFGGFIPSMLGSVFATGTYFFAYESVKRAMIDAELPPSTAYFCGGAVSDMASAVFSVPAELLKTRFQLQGVYNNPYSVSQYNYPSLWAAVRRIYSLKGVKGLYAGWEITLMRDVPFSALQFLFYEHAQQKVAPMLLRDGWSPLAVDLSVGGAAGGLAGCLTTPLDVIKTRIQTGDTTGNTSFSAIARELRAAYARGSLTAGWMPRTTWTAVQSAVFFALYEAGLNHYRIHWGS